MLIGYLIAIVGGVALAVIASKIAHHITRREKS